MTMQTILEIFYVRIMGEKVYYQRKQANLSKKGGDPDGLIQSLIQEKRRSAAGQVEQSEFILHSTSWRYARPGKILLTYVAYSDAMEFEGTFHSLPLKKLRTLTQRSRAPRSRAELEKKVVSHAMRHIAFLIRTGAGKQFERALLPETREVLENLWVSLAGRIF
jgi:hypothetical protein